MSIQLEYFSSLCVRPYQLMCIVCKLGSGLTSDLLDAKLTGILREVRKNPVIPVTLRCNVDSLYRYQNPGRSDDSPEGDLFNDKRDLDVLQKLGLEYGATMPARQLYSLLFKKIQSTRQICGYNDGIVRGPEWSICGGPEGNEAYEKGREKGLGIRGVSIK